MLKVVLADDHLVLLDALVCLAASFDPSIVLLTAASFDGALALVEANPDVSLTVLGLELPGMEGLAALDGMLSRHPGLACAVLAGSPSPEQVRSALAHGACGVIPKTMAGKPLLQILRLMAFGERYVPPELISAAAARPGRTGLSPREREIMELLRGGLSNKEIARRLSVDEGTVKQHLRHVFGKLGVHNRVLAIQRYFASP